MNSSDSNGDKITQVESFEVGMNFNKYHELFGGEDLDMARVSPVMIAQHLYLSGKKRDIGSKERYLLSDGRSLDFETTKMKSNETRWKTNYKLSSPDIDFMQGVEMTESY